MTPQQKHSVLVMLESIEHQLKAVKLLLDIPMDAPSVRHEIAKQQMPNDYLDDAEEAELEKMLKLTPEEKTTLLNVFNNGEGTPDVPGSDKI